MKYGKIILICGTVALPTPVFAQAICSGLLDKASIDEQDIDFDIALANSLYKNSCSGSSSSRTFNAETGMDAVIGVIPFKGTGNFSSKKETLNQFCKTFKKSKYFRNESTLRNRTVVREALLAFNRCIEFSNKSLFISPKITKTQVSIDVRRGGEPAKLLKVLTNSDLMSCTVKDADGIEQDASQFTTVDLNSVYSTSIICERIAKTEQDGSTIYEGVDVTVGTNRGSFQFTVPEERKLPSKWAADFQGDIQILRQQSKIAEDTITKLKNGLTDWGNAPTLTSGLSYLTNPPLYDLWGEKSFRLGVNAPTTKSYEVNWQFNSQTPASCPEGHYVVAVEGWG